MPWVPPEVAAMCGREGGPDRLYDVADPTVLLLHQARRHAANAIDEGLVPVAIELAAPGRGRRAAGGGGNAPAAAIVGGACWPPGPTAKSSLRPTVRRSDAGPQPGLVAS